MQRIRLTVPATAYPLAIAAGTLIACLSGPAHADPPAWPTLPTEDTPPTRTAPLYIYFEGPQIVADDPLWELMNTRFQLRCDMRLTSAGYWAGNNFPGDHPSDPSVFRPYAGPTDFAQQVVNRLSAAYAAVPQWPVAKPKLHGFEFIGVNGMSSPWRDVDNPNDYIGYGGDLYTYPLASASVNGTTQTITSSDLASFGPPAWAPSTAYGVDAWGRDRTVNGGGFHYTVEVAGTSGSSPPTWGPAIVVDGTVTWKKGDFGNVLLSGFASAANNGVYLVVEKPSSTSIKVTYRFGAGGDPAHLADESSASNVKLHTLFAQDLWRANGRSGSAALAEAHFEAMKDALDEADEETLPLDISRTFVHYVEDDESLHDYKPQSVTWYYTTPTGDTNMPDWETDGLWQRNAADSRFSTTPSDGVYTPAQMLARAEDILNGGDPLDDPFTMTSPWSPVQETLRTWHWLNIRSAQSIIAKSRFEPFKDVFGNIPCGNWNLGATSGDPEARLIIEPHGGEPSTGIAIDNYEGSEHWTMSIPAMYGGVLGDYRGTASLSHPAWSTEANWSDEFEDQGGTITTTSGTVARNFQIGEIALRQYAASVKRNYGYGHQVMPSLSMGAVVTVTDATERKWVLVRLSKSLSKAYNEGLIDSVWAFAPEYTGSADSREAWYILSAEVFRLTTIPVDYDLSGVVGVQDIFDFLAFWYASDPRADYDNDELITEDDITIFLDDWFNS